MDNKFMQITTSLLDLMVILHKKIFNPLSLAKATNLTPAQFSVLFYLMRHDNSSVSEVAGYLQISKPNMTPILDSLIELGYIERNRDSRDRRVVRLKLTDTGQDFYSNMKEVSKELVEEIFKDYTVEELDRLMEQSKELLETMGRISGFEETYDLNQDDE